MSVITEKRLADLLETNNWFRAGSSEQRNKLFEGNSNGLTVDMLSGIIWLCSENVPREQILSILKEEEQKELDEIVKNLAITFGYIGNDILIDDPYICYEMV